jgi:hypothetical protein
MTLAGVLMGPRLGNLDKPTPMKRPSTKARSWVPAGCRPAMTALSLRALIVSTDNYHNSNIEQQSILNHKYQIF